MRSLCALVSPSVLKPRSGEASRNTYLVETADELRHHLEDLSTTDVSEAPKFILESYIPDAAPSVAGIGFAGYVSVESIVSGGVVSHLAVTGRTPVAPPFREDRAPSSPPI